MARGSWRTARFCLSRGGRPGFVEIPRGGRSRHAVALWGVLTGEAPDEVPVDVDEDGDVLIVHLVDASDPDAVRDRHRRAYEDAQRRVVR
jgi:multisubunit Na+/H+ antiporter MnhE subunit